MTDQKTADTDTPKLSRSQQLLNRYKDEVKRETENERKADANRKIVLGAAMIAAMNADPDAREKIVAWLDQYTTKPNDRKRVERWLPQRQA